MWGYPNSEEQFRDQECANERSEMQRMVKAEAEAKNDHTLNCTSACMCLGVCMCAWTSHEFAYVVLSTQSTKRQ